MTGVHDRETPVTAPGRAEDRLTCLIVFLGLRGTPYASRVLALLPKGNQEDARGSTRRRCLPELARIPGAPGTGGEL